VAKGGGGLYMAGGSVSITDGSVLADNAAINTRIPTGECTLDDCPNYVGDGGAVYMDGGELIITDSSFLNNTAHNTGGAVKIIGGSVVAHGNFFDGNYADVLNGWAENNMYVFIQPGCPKLRGSIYCIRAARPHRPPNRFIRPHAQR